MKLLFFQRSFLLVFLSTSTGHDARISSIHFLLFFFFLLLLDFHELSCSLMSTHLFTEVKQQWATLVLGWVTGCVVGQVWDVSDFEFVFVTRLSYTLVHFSYLVASEP